MSGALATLVLLVSGILAVAPYVGFLTPVAALGVGLLPFVISSAVFFAAIVVFTVVISKNKTIAAFSLLEKKRQENSELRNKIGTQKQRISEREAEVSILEKQLVKNEIISDLNELKSQEYAKKKQNEVLDSVVSNNLSGENLKKGDKISSLKKQPTKVNGYLNQAVSAVN